MTKIKHIERQERNPITRIMLGVAAGGIVGVTTALLLAPKAGKRLRGELYNAYEDISERSKDFINDAMDKGQTAVKSTGEFADNVKATAREFMRNTPDISNPNVNLLIGALAGGCIGAAAIYMLSHKEIESDFATKIKAAGRGASHWIDTARDVLGSIQSTANNLQHNGSEILDDVQNNKMHDVLEFASLGLRLWENIKKRG
jgi:gas vesicle protein